MDSIRIKNEFFKNCNTISYCHACLSSDRALSTVTKYVDIYYKILDIQDMIPPKELLLCWECSAILIRISMFKKKVAEAQRILQCYYTNKQGPFPNSLSQLNIHTINNQKYLTYEENETKEIKEEINIYDDIDHIDSESIKNEPEFDETSNVTVETANVTDETPNVTDETANVTDETPNVTDETANVTVKVTSNDLRETVPETSKNDWREFNMKRLMNRKAKYRFLNTKLRKHRRLLVKKIPMQLHDLMIGLEMERSDTLFLNADYKCVGCVATWTNEEGVSKHRKKYHDEIIGPYQCEICKVYCPCKEKLQTHQSKHYYQKECKVCQYQSCSQHSMDRHLEQHNRMVQCLACELCFKNVRLFYNHYKALHAKFVCEVCGKRCKSRILIEKHLRNHFGYECPYCKKKLKNTTSYKNHVDTQHSSSVSDGAYCVQCDRRFSNERMYKRHVQSSAAHAPERDGTRAKRKYPCPECSNVYSRRTYMNNHYRHVHSKQSKYYCGDCDRHFLNRTRYLDHRRFQHEGVKKDKDKLCNICGRGFAANRTLVNHIRTHSGERPFACEYCGAKFTQKHAMLSHVKYIHLKSKRKPSWHE